MTIVKILYLVAVVLLFLAGIGSTVLPSPMIWALFCIALGLLLSGYEFNFRRR